MGQIHVKDICDKFPCAPFTRHETGKIVWVPSSDHLRIRINTAFRYSYFISVFRHFLDKKVIKVCPEYLLTFIRTDRLSTKDRYM